MQRTIQGIANTIKPRPNRLVVPTELDHCARETLQKNSTSSSFLCSLCSNTEIASSFIQSPMDPFGGEDMFSVFDEGKKESSNDSGKKKRKPSSFEPDTTKQSGEVYEEEALKTLKKTKKKTANTIFGNNNSSETTSKEQQTTNKKQSDSNKEETPNSVSNGETSLQTISTNNNNNNSNNNRNSSDNNNNNNKSEVISCLHELCLPPADEAQLGEIEDPQYPLNPVRTWPFELDPFQKKSVACLESGHSVLVSAHTSAGKTVIAE